MMSAIANTSSLRPTLAAAPPAPPAPKKPAEETADQVDFLNINTPHAAASLPIMSPATQFFLVSAIMAASQSSHPPTVYVTAAVTTGSAKGQADPGFAVADYIVDVKNPKTPITQGGIEGGAFDYKTLTIDPASQTATYDGRGTTLKFAPDQATGSLKADGHLGTVDAHLTITGRQEGGIHVEGKLGGSDYLLDTSMYGDNDGLHMSSTGKLGDEAISLAYKFDGATDADGNQIAKLTSTGNIGRYSQNVEASLRVGKDK